MAKNAITELNHQAWELRFSDARQALQWAEGAYQLANHAGDRPNLARSMRTISFCHLMNSNYEQALQYGHRALDLFTLLNDTVGQSEATRTLGRIHWSLGDFATALDFNLRTLSFAEASGDHELLAHTYNNTAMSYVRLENFAKVEEMVGRALAIFETLGNHQGLALGYNNLAMLHFSAESYAQALYCAQTAYQHVQKIADVNLKINVLDTLGQIYPKVEEDRRALEHLEMARQLAQTEGLKRSELYADLNIGRIYLQQNQPTLALDHVKRAFALAESLASDQMLLDCHELLATIYKATRDLDSALYHHETYHQLYRTVFTQQRDDKFAKLEVRYRTETAVREAEIYRQKNEELQHEIFERQRAETALIKAKESAEIANQAKSRFIANMSHELRTPLNGILGYAQLLQRDASFNPQQAEGLNVIYQSGTHLLTLINDILDISKLEANKITLQPSELTLRSCLDGIIAMMRMAAESKWLELVPQIDDALPNVILADEKRLRQILINLLGNAIKFTQQGRITFCARLLALDDATCRLRFEVIDTGCGIAQADLSKIFQPFEQVEQIHNLQQTGTGLGLSISHELVETMGGQIQVESELGVGSRFWFDVTFRLATTIETPALLIDPRLEKPSIAELRRYLDLADLGDLITLQQALEELARADPRYASFATPLIAAASRFDESAVLRQLKSHLAFSNSPAA